MVGSNTIYEEVQHRKRERLQQAQRELRARARAEWQARHPGCALPEHLRIRPDEQAR